jgi:L-lactate utilization protein LutB
MCDIIFQRRELLAQKIIKNLEKRHFEAYYAKNKNEALQQALEIISKDETISWGGSMTIEEIGLIDYLENNGYKTFNRSKAKTSEEKREIVIKGLSADNFLMSANALSEDGEIVNIDGHGNRISALCYGPEKIIMVIGMNKIAKNLDDAISRARNTAAPINAKRVSNYFEVETPCIQTGSCADCKSETSICSQILITRLCWPKKRIKVILVNEDLGY